MNERQSTKAVVGPVRFSYCHVWEPAAAQEGGEKKYSVSIIIPKTNRPAIKKLQYAIEAAIDAGIHEKFRGKRPANLKTPLRDGDVERPDDPTYAGSMFLNATSKTRPGIVDRDHNDILDQTEFYSGCYGYVSINFYAFNTSGNVGIAAGLNNIMKTKDGPALGGRETAQNDFAGIEVEDDEDDFFD